MRFYLLLFTLFATAFLFGDENILKTRLKQAKEGDFVVIAQGKSISLMQIRKVAPPRLLMEEVTLPAHQVCRQTDSWRRWFEKGAPMHTSWILYQLNLDKGEIEQYYSYTKRSHFTLPEGDNFLATLLHLNLYPVPTEERKKVGLPPREFQQDKRKFWNPEMVVDGAVVPEVPFDAYYTRWPKDDSPLADKLIEIYLPASSSEYPAYFPYFLQVRGVLGPSKVRIIDSGRGLISPQPLQNL